MGNGRQEDQPRESPPCPHNGVSVTHNVTLLGENRIILIKIRKFSVNNFDFLSNKMNFLLKITRIVLRNSYFLSKKSCFLCKKLHLLIKRLRLLITIWDFFSFINPRNCLFLPAIRRQTRPLKPCQFRAEVVGLFSNPDHPTQQGLLIHSTLFTAWDFRTRRRSCYSARRRRGRGRRRRPCRGNGGRRRPGLRR